MTKLSQKHIPTLLGIGILVVSLIGGVFFIGKGGGVFAPRASPQTTPKNLKSADVTDKSFTVSFVTDEATAGYINYGTTATALSTRVADDRDQLSGSVGQFTTHYVTIRDLTPSTQYYFTVGTGSVPKFDNNGTPFIITTAKQAGTLSAAKTIYGVVSTTTGNPAAGAIVYVDSPNMGEVSALVRDSGSWAIPLANARTSDGSSFATITDTTPLTLFIQGTSATVNQTLTVDVKDALPVKTITLGSGASGVSSIAQQVSSTLPSTQISSSGGTVSGTGTCNAGCLTDNNCGSGLVCYQPPMPSCLPGVSCVQVLPSKACRATACLTSSTCGCIIPPSPSPILVSPTPSPHPTPLISPSPTSGTTSSTTYTFAFPSPSPSPSLPSSFLTNPTPTTYTFQTPPPSPTTTVQSLPTSNLIVNTAASTPQSVNTTQPTVIGQVAPNTTVTIIIHSTTAVTSQVTTDANGNFAYDLSSQSQNLAPGKHTVTVSYVDPQTGKLVTRTQTFTVLVSAATATNTAGPYSTNNPFPVITPSPITFPSSSPIMPTTPVTKIASSSAILPKTGSVGTTYLLIFGGLFFILTGTGSFILSRRRNDG